MHPQDGHIGDKLASTVTSVTAAVTDPALLNNVQKGATSLWGKAASVGECDARLAMQNNCS